MKFDASKIRKILVISLSNIGDCILTFPTLDILKRDFPQSVLSVVIGPKAEGLFQDNPHIAKIYIFNKRQSFLKTLSWIRELRKAKFDLVVDLRNTAIPFLINAKYKTPLEFGKAHKMHMKQKHLNRLGKVLDFTAEPRKRFMLAVNQKDKNLVASLLFLFVKEDEKYVVIAPGAANHLKCWKEEGFAALADHLIEQHKTKIVFAGDKNDEAVAGRIQKLMKHRTLNLCGKTTLLQLAALLDRSSLVVTNDSGVMHMASYLDYPVVAIFGPTDPVYYSPWSQNARVVKSAALCKACGNPSGQLAHTCMDSIQLTEIIHAVNGILERK